MLYFRQNKKETIRFTNNVVKSSSLRFVIYMSTPISHHYQICDISYNNYLTISRNKFNIMDIILQYLTIYSQKNTTYRSILYTPKGCMWFIFGLFSSPSFTPSFVFNLTIKISTLISILF